MRRLTTGRHTRAPTEHPCAARTASPRPQSGGMVQRRPGLAPSPPPREPHDLAGRRATRGDLREVMCQPVALQARGSRSTFMTTSRPPGTGAGRRWPQVHVERRDLAPDQSQDREPGIGSGEHEHRAARLQQDADHLGRRTQPGVRVEPGWSMSCARGEAARSAGRDGLRDLLVRDLAQGLPAHGQVWRSTGSGGRWRGAPRKRSAQPR